MQRLRTLTFAGLSWTAIARAQQDAQAARRSILRTRPHAACGNSANLQTGPGRGQPHSCSAPKAVSRERSLGREWGGPVRGHPRRGYENWFQPFAACCV